MDRHRRRNTSRRRLQSDVDSAVAGGGAGLFRRAETVVPVAMFMRKNVIPFFAVSCLFSTGISTGISTGNFQWFVNHIIVIKSHHRDKITSS